MKVKTVLWEQFGVKIHPGSVQTWDTVPITVPSSASPSSLPHCDLIDICYMIKVGQSIDGSLGCQIRSINYTICIHV